MKAHRRNLSSVRRPAGGGRDGSVLVAVLLVVTVLGIILGSYMKLSVGEYKGATDAYEYNALLNLAEAGAEDAIWALNHEDWSGWQANGLRKYKKISGFDLGDGRFADVEVGIDHIDGTTVVDEPVVYVGAEVVGGSARGIDKQIKMELTYRSMFANGLTAINQLRFAGGNAEVDSYNSDNGPYDTFLNRTDKGTAGSLSVSIDAVDLANADVYGYVATGKEQPDVGPNGRVHGPETPSGVKVDPNRVTTDFYAEFPLPEVPALTNPITSLPGGNNKVIGLGSTPGNPEVYHLNNLNLNGQKNLTIAGDVVIVIDGAADVKTQINLINDATATIYAKGDFSIGGNGIVNDSQVPSKMVIYGVAPTPNGQEIKLHGNGSYSGVVYAPNATISLKGGGNSGAMFGAAVGYDIDVVGNYEFHYDEALGNFFGDRPTFLLKSWHELLRAEDRLEIAAWAGVPPVSQP